MKCHIGKLLLASLCVSGLAACLRADPVEVAMVAVDTRPYGISINASNTYAYSGAAWNHLTASISNPGGGPLLGATGGVSMTAYSNAACTMATSNPINIASSWILDSIANISGISYNWHEPNLEGNLYYRVNTNYGSACSSAPVRIVRKFNDNHNGYSHFSHFVPAGAAGGWAGQNYAEGVGGMATDSSGRIIVVGNSRRTDGGKVMVIWRYNPDGSADTNFGGDGAVTFGPDGAAGATGANTNDNASSIAIDSSGRYVIAGGSTATDGGFLLTLWRYNPDGSLDTTFGTGGALVYANSTTGLVGADIYEYALDMILDSSGKYVIVTYSQINTTDYNYTYSILRFNTNGTLDTTFSGDGIATGSVTTGATGSDLANLYDYGAAIQQDSEGRYVVAGDSNNNAMGQELAMWRHNNNGTLDATFSGDGIYTGGATSAGGSNSESASSLKIESSGKIVLAGKTKKAGGGYAMAIWRFNSNGTPDTSDAAYSAAGAVYFSPTGPAGAANASQYDSGSILRIDYSGRYVVAGTSKNTDAGFELAIWRYNSNGTPDTTFDGDGAVHFGSTGVLGGLTSNEFDSPSAFQIDSAGRYVITGLSQSNAGAGYWGQAVWRYKTDGTLDY
ncbi:MAG: hypothetical protein A2583_12475 [Bdellovibrionales bacterium RIFOXYD1_FULL_53_11]|nr:MAG: hypothetical protein A2583_12475 [Bdellovibrionales bacterium RIFOXYD1_FULL_53_11]